MVDRSRRQALASAAAAVALLGACTASPEAAPVTPIRLDEAGSASPRPSEEAGAEEAPLPAVPRAGVSPSATRPSAPSLPTDASSRAGGGSAPRAPTDAGADSDRGTDDEGVDDPPEDVEDRRMSPSVTHDNGDDDDPVSDDVGADGAEGEGDDEADDE